MRSSIYISPEHIEVVGYDKSGDKVSVLDYQIYDLPEESVINGKIIDAAHIVQGLAAMKAKKPGLFTDVSLIIDGSSIFSKKIVTPKLKDWQLNLIIRDEFSDVAGNPDELICDYYPLSTGDGDDSGSILACAMEKSQLDSYLSIFNEVQIKISSVHVGVQSVLQYIDSREDLLGKTFAINIIDGVTMLSMIFSNGVSILISRARLYGDDRGTLIQNMIENLSGFIQFIKSQGLNDITHSFYLGLNSGDMDLIQLYNQHPDIRFDVLPLYEGVKGAERLPPRAHFAYLNTLLDKDSFDLIRSEKMLSKVKKKQQPKKIWIPVLAGIMLLLAIPTVFLAIQASGLNREVRALRAYVEDEARQAKAAELDTIAADTQQIRAVISDINKKVEADRGKLTINTILMRLIVEPLSERVSVTAFEFNEEAGTIRVTGRSVSENDASLYVEDLKRSRLIEYAYYTGYASDTTGYYSFSIDVKISAGEGER